MNPMISFSQKCIIAFSVFASALTFAVRDANACSCMWSEFPCGPAKHTKAIFVSEVVDFKQVGDERMAEVVVSESFSGGATGRVKVSTSSGGGSCGFDFRVGEQYLIYAHKEKDGFSTSICTRTKPFGIAGGEIELLRQKFAGKPPRGPLLFGTILSFGRDVQERPKPLSGVSLSVTGKNGRVFRVITKANGLFLITGMPPGQYLVEATDPSGRKKREVVSVSAQRCNELPMWFKSGGMLSGRVTDSDGKPVKGMRVIAMLTKSVDDQDQDWNSYDSYTDSDGRFVIEGLPAGRFYVAANLLQPVKKEMPYRTQYFGGSDRQTTKVFAVGDDSFFSAVDFGLPKPEVARAVRGTVRLLDGKPLSGAVVKLKLREPGWEMDEAETAADGVFNLIGFGGQKYDVEIFQSPNLNSQDLMIHKFSVDDPATAKATDVPIDSDGRITGKVVAADGRQLRWFRLYLQSQEVSGLKEILIPTSGDRFSFLLMEGARRSVYAFYTDDKGVEYKSPVKVLSRDDIGREIRLVIPVAAK